MCTHPGMLQCILLAFESRAILERFPVTTRNFANRSEVLGIGQPFFRLTHAETPSVFSGLSLLIQRMCGYWTRACKFPSEDITLGGVTGGKSLELFFFFVCGESGASLCWLDAMKVDRSRFSQHSCLPRGKCLATHRHNYGYVPAGVRQAKCTHCKNQMLTLFFQGLHLAAWEG